MKLSLSTNWCCRRIETGEEIAETALALGFDELELGFHTTQAQADGFRRSLDRIPVGSVHAFCPVPISAPQGYPELYSLASLDEDQRAIARFHVLKNVAFAADMGADTVVLHAGRVPFSTFLHRRFSSHDLRDALLREEKKTDAPRYGRLLARARKVRAERGARMLDVFRGEIAALVPELEKAGVALALENMPYLEGFPDEGEMAKLAEEFRGAPVKGWFDTGHDRVRLRHGWTADSWFRTAGAETFAGMHLNDVEDLYDEHKAPGEGKVDFAAMKEFARAVGHVVFEPCGAVSRESLEKSVAFIRSIW
ncbi:MAG: sugar phosphate isomerase/epimerase [Kiritimatiellae bacterium]|nr:sugar phosphate isomerase/epimerase [Kiritimatiellia bacterium]